MDDRWGVVARILAVTNGRGDDRCSKRVVRIGISTAHTLIDGFLKRCITFYDDGLPQFDEHHHDPGILADGTVTLGRHA